MIKADEFNRVCRLAGLVQVKGIAKWATEKKDEGIELVNNKILTFTFKDGELDHNGKIQDNKIISVLGAFEKDIQEAENPKQEKKDGKTDRKEAQEQKDIIPGSLVNSIPDILMDKRIITFQDIEELKTKPLFDRLLLFQKTPAKLIKKRRGFLLPASASKDKKSLTDSDYMMYQYVPANTMNQEGNLAFLYKFSTVVEDRRYYDNPFEVVVSGYIETKIDGEVIRRACGGSMQAKGNMDKGDVMEGAISEMTKRGLKKFGFNADVYRQEGEEV